MVFIGRILFFYYYKYPSPFIKFFHFIVEYYILMLDDYEWMIP